MWFFKRDLTLLAICIIAALVIGFTCHELWPLLSLAFTVWLFVLLRQRWFLERSLLYPTKYALPTKGFCGAMLKTIKNATALQCEQELLIKRTHQLKCAFEAMSDGMLIVNKHFELESWNKAATDLLGLDYPQDLHTPITALIHHPKFNQYCEEIEPNKALTLRSPINPQCYLQWQLTPFEGQYLFIVRDITRAQHLEQMQHDFVANVSHELNTPLTVLTGYLEPLSDIAPTVLPANLVRGINHMTQQTQRMKNLITDLLMLARLENESLEAIKQPINLLSLFDEMKQIGEILSNGRHQIDYQLVSKAQLLGAKEEIRSALTNLLSNAVRYSGNGSQILMRWSILSSGEGALEVIDNGIGIAKCHLPYLSQRFYRVDKSRSTATGGTGLGLAIVKRIILHHQGQLDVESTPRQGAQFRLRFPATRLLFSQKIA